MVCKVKYYKSLCNRFSCTILQSCLSTLMFIIIFIVLSPEHSAYCIQYSVIWFIKCFDHVELLSIIQPFHIFFICQYRRCLSTPYAMMFAMRYKIYRSTVLFLFAIYTSGLHCFSHHQVCSRQVFV